MSALDIAAASGAARSIPRRLKAARENAGLTQGQVADAIGVARETVCRWECGAISPRLSEAVCWAAAVGFSVNMTDTSQEVSDERRL